MKSIDHFMRKVRPSGRTAARVAVLELVAALAGIAPAAGVGPKVYGNSPVVVAEPEVPVVNVKPMVVAAPEVRVAPIARAFAEAVWSESPEGWFGIGLSCDDCTISHDEEGTAVWEFDTAPRIQYVDPDGPAGKAGLESGDVLQKIDGMAITSKEGGKKFGAVQPGDAVRWTYERKGKSHEVKLVAEEHPDRWGWDAETAAAIQASIASLHDEQARLAAEAQAMEADKLSKQAYENVLKKMEEAQRAMEKSSKAWRGKYSWDNKNYWDKKQWDTMVVPAFPETPASSRHKLRYEGTIGGSEVEVRGSGAVVVTEDAEDEIVITTPDATIHIRTKK